MSKLERAFLSAMPDYMKSHWGVNEEKIIFDFIRSWALEIVKEVDIICENNGRDNACYDMRKKIEEELEE